MAPVDLLFVGVAEAPADDAVGADTARVVLVHRQRLEAVTADDRRRIRPIDPRAVATLSVVVVVAGPAVRDAVFREPARGLRGQDDLLPADRAAAGLRDRGLADGARGAHAAAVAMASATIER